MIAAIGFLLFGIAIYRAGTQSFTIDEAHTYAEYVRVGWSEIFNGWFDANNHVLYSALARICVTAFGLSEFTMRLPALMGAGLFLWSLARLTSRLVRQTGFRILCYLVVAANPPTLDFMAAARGYGLALGLFAYALSEIVEWLEDGRDWRVPLASLALGLAIGANLTFAFAAVGAMAAATVWVIRRWKATLLLKLAAPCVATALALWWFPFRSYEPGRFYYGYPDVADSLESIASVLFRHDVDRGDPFANWFTLYYFRMWIVPAVMAGLAITLALRSKRKDLAFLILTLLSTCAAVWIAHSGLGVLYPRARTGLALTFLFLLCWMAAMAELWNGRATRWLFAGPSLVLSLVILYQFAWQFDARYFGPWKSDWKMNELMSQLQGKQGTIKAHWLKRATAEFYRDKLHLNFPEIPRHQGETLELTGADYYIVPSVTNEQLTASGLRILYLDGITGTALLYNQAQAR